MKKLLTALIFLTACATARSAPTISGVSGTLTNGQTIVISGASFGTKSPAAPIRWAPFDSSSNGSALGQSTSWNQIENMSWSASEGYDGGGGMKGTAGQGTWTMRVDSSGWNWNGDSQKWIAIRRSKQNYLVTPDSQQPAHTPAYHNNQKDFRIYCAGGAGTYPNLYWSLQNNRCYVEKISSPQDSGFYSSGFNHQSTSWLFQEIIGQASSAINTKDGSLTYRINGTQRAAGAIMTRSTTYPDLMVTGYVAQIVVANKGSWNPAWSTSNNVWFDDIYVDNTWSRVYIGDASTYANCRKFGMVIPSAWSAGSVTGVLQFHSSDFPAGSTAYVYVFDSNNVPNATGKAITIGGVVVGNPAPTVTSVNVSTGSYLGGTSATATCTGLIATPTVLVGTQPATNVVMNSATSIRFTIPDHFPPGTAGSDLTVTNPDLQFGVLTATMSWDSPVANQPPYEVSAGDDWEITLPDTTFISGLASDDGLPSGTLTYLWQKKSGPGSVSFVDATALQTTALFSAAGTYTITLTASDGSLSTESPTVNVIVHAAVVTGSGASAFPWKR